MEIEIKMVVASDGGGEEGLRRGKREVSGRMIMFFVIY